MKIESISFYDVFDNYVDLSPHLSEVLDYDFHSLHECALHIRKFLKHHSFAHRAFAFMDNWRYLYVTDKTYDVHYHAFFETNL